MFGYVRYDLPNLYIKDFELYRAMYCGLCKGIAHSCGQMARIGLTYDMTFLSVLLHNLAGIDVKIEKQNCFEHTIKKQPIAVTDELTDELGALNTVLLYYKLTDDIEDGDKGRGKRLWFKRGFKRAKRGYPELVSLVKGYMKAQQAAEKGKCDSLDRAADPTAELMQRLSRHFLKDKATPHTDGLFYALGKWIYLIDALDDYDKDRKKRRYNPFVLAYGSESKEALIKEHGGDIAFLFDTLFYGLREDLANIHFYFNRDLTDNVLLRGIPLETQRVMRGEKPVKMQVDLK